jgi:lipid II:glycine glycyltransferase (peptidoglycan interpeptide bridge formation enzyme)
MHSDMEPAQWDKRQRDLRSSFLQTALWARFQASVGHKPHFVSGDGWSCLLLERKAPIGRYLFAPYGPTVSKNATPQAALESIKAYGRSQKADWLRLEPVISQLSPDEQRRILKAAGGRPVREVEPGLTRIVDLKRPADDILASFSQTTRNIIRRNQRQAILTFKTSRDPEDMPILTDMLEKVARRKSIGFFTADYYRRQAEILMPAGMMTLEIACDGQTPVGAAIIHDFAGISSYTNAGSLPEARDRNVSALLLWQAMVNAKDRGNTAIDLYGIAPDDAGPSHPWHGFSGFKKKFGGEVMERAGTWDIPLTPKYKLYRSALSAKRLIKRR